MEKLGVRELVEFLLKSGDLNGDMKSLNTKSAGSRIHRKLQSKRGANYKKEYYLDYPTTIANKDYLINGRCDGVIFKKKSAIIEEIKTSDVPFAEMSNNKKQLYWAQLYAYAFLLMNQTEEINQVTLRLTYVQTPDEIITKKEKRYTQKEAQVFFTDLLSKLKEWLRLKQELTDEKIETASKLTFPFPAYRKGQHELAAAVFKTIIKSKHLFAQAPTGVGKTISTLFPTIKAMGKKKISRAFYLTAKQSTRRVAEDTIKELSKNGLRLRSITITAKNKIKFPEEADLPDDKNPFLVGYYDRVKPALMDVLENNHEITRPIIEKYARKYTLDPFEFSLDVSLFCDVIIGDYNYLFDPQVHLQRFFDFTDRNNFYLIDEAHNLVDRSRDMYSTELTSASVDEALGELSKAEDKHKKLKQRLIDLKKQFQLVKQPLVESNSFQTATDDSLSEFTKAVQNTSIELRKWAAKNDVEQSDDPLLNLYFQCLSFLKINEFFGPNYKMRIIIDEDTVTVKEFCMNPSEYLADTLNLGGGAVLFSATLSPMPYYQKVLGGEPDSLSYQLPSPFPKENQNIIVTSYIDTKFKNRNRSLKKVVSSIEKLISGKRGNYLIFAPSSNYLSEIYNLFTKRNPQIKTIRQTPDMDETQRAAFINAFSHPPSKLVVGFALLGGIFSEGIDLVGDKLIGIGIVGVGLPGINPETNLIRDYFDQENGNGFQFAYQLPGLNNVFQAAGRLIRSQKDKGIVLLMDNRFLSQRYRQHFPTSWDDFQIAHTPQELADLISKFWGKSTQ